MLKPPPLMVWLVFSLATWIVFLLGVAIGWVFAVGLRHLRGC